MIISDLTKFINTCFIEYQTFMLKFNELLLKKDKLKVKRIVNLLSIMLILKTLQEN